ncbi:hypothetical protein [Nocardia otitidiscaviarum]|uniref:hypothetical protein n=1 Tax=Nocardia otitidiscaviarum TaxID=1823 RepID=UPI000584ABCB|nr:hypothetical protein [Nocardia otitidiscaviarum]
MTQTTDDGSAAVPRAVPVAEAQARFGIRQLFDLARADDRDTVLVAPGGVRVSQLPLDFHALDRWAGIASDPAACGLVVDGDLTVTGAVTNWESDFGPFLLVRGDLRAGDLGTGGSQVRVEGATTVTRTLFGHYNHGRGVFRGTVRAEVVAVDEHLLEFHAGLTAEVVAAGNFLRLADPGRARVTAWAGRVTDLEGKALTTVGSPTARALRLLAEPYWDLDARAVLAAQSDGRSLLARHPVNEFAEQEQRGAHAAAVERALRRAELPAYHRFQDGFRVDEGAEPVQVYHCEADEPDPEADPPDETAFVRRCADVLTAAGFRVEYDPDDEEVLRVHE